MSISYSLIILDYHGCCYFILFLNFAGVACRSFGFCLSPGYFSFESIVTCSYGTAFAFEGWELFFGLFGIIYIYNYICIGKYHMAKTENITYIKIIIISKINIIIHHFINILKIFLTKIGQS